MTLEEMIKLYPNIGRASLTRNETIVDAGYSGGYRGSNIYSSEAFARSIIGADRKSKTAALWELIDSACANCSADRWWITLADGRCLVGWEDGSSVWWHER